MNDLKCAVNFIADLILLCDMTKGVQQRLLKPIRASVGDYMGSGYAFTDAFNKIYDEFSCSCSDELWQEIRKAIDEKI